MCACLMMLLGIIFVIFLVFIAAEKSKGPKITNIKEPPKTKKPEFRPPAQGKEKLNLKKD